MTTDAEVIAELRALVDRETRAHEETRGLLVTALVHRDRFKTRAEAAEARLNEARNLWRKLSRALD